jgi:Lrp/AsnC family leucine-responsive transcriptional regulator
MVLDTLDRQKAYDAFCEACLLHDANVRSFTTQIVLDAAKRGGPLDIPKRVDG